MSPSVEQIQSLCDLKSFLPLWYVSRYLLLNVWRVLIGWNKFLKDENKTWLILWNFKITLSAFTVSFLNNSLHIRWKIRRTLARRASGTNHSLWVLQIALFLHGIKMMKKHRHYAAKNTFRNDGREIKWNVFNWPYLLPGTGDTFGCEIFFNSRYNPLMKLLRSWRIKTLPETWKKITKKKKKKEEKKVSNA